MYICACIWWFAVRKFSAEPSSTAAVRRWPKPVHLWRHVAELPGAPTGAVRGQLHAANGSLLQQLPTAKVTQIPLVNDTLHGREMDQFDANR